MMNLFNLRTGKKLDGPVAIVSDLDKMISEPIAFRLHGKVHSIKPLSVKEFYKYSNALARLNGLRDKDQVGKDDLIDSYFVLFSSVIDSFTIKDLENMTQVQVSALFQLILDAVRGRAYTDEEEEKKKPLSRESI